MSNAEETKLVLARAIAGAMDEASRQIAYAIIALFSGSEDDLKKASSGIPANKVIHIKVLLALEKVAEVLNIILGFSDDQAKERSEAELSLVSFFADKGRIKDAWERVWFISDPERKASAMQRIALDEEKVIKRMAEEIAELRLKLALAESGAAQGPKSSE